MSSQVVIQPGDTDGVDTYVLSGQYANVNFGDADLLSIGTATVAKVTVFSRALFRFDLRALPARAVILAAELTLFHGDGGSLSAAAALAAYRLTRGDWTEYGASWNQYDGAHAWTAPGSDFATLDHDATTVASTTADVVFANLKNLAIDALANRGGWLQLVVIGPESGGSNNFVTVLSSSEANPAASRPRLVVTYDPPVPLSVPNFTGGMQQLTGQIGA
jgi:hypothetical protein